MHSPGALGDGGVKTAAFFTSSLVLDAPVNGVCWTPAALFTRASAARLFDERPRTARLQRSAAVGERARCALFIDAANLCTHMSGALCTAL